MKIGDLVKCNFQPRCAGYDNKCDRLVPMDHKIKGELGIIVAINQNHNFVLFPQFGHTHALAAGTLEVICD